MTRLSVPHAPASASDVRHALVRELRARGVHHEVIDDASVVISELFGNAVRHGRPLPDGTVRVAWLVDGDVVRIEVSDGGPGLYSALPERRDAPASAESGRGLPIVERLTSRWGTSVDGSNHVFAELPLHGSVARH